MYSASGEFFFIKANVWGKTRYWNHVDGRLDVKRRGISCFKKETAKKIFNHLKEAVHDGIILELLPEGQLPQFTTKHRK